MMLEFTIKYPRILAALFAALCAGIMAIIAADLVHGVPYPGIYITSAVISSAFWAAIIGKRVTNVIQSCTYFRAAVLGAIAASLAILTVAIFVNIGMRFQNMFNGLASFKQTLRYLVIDDLSSSLGGGVFVLVFFGWYLVPLGGLAGVVLRWLRTLYEEDEQNELYEGDDCARLHTGDE